MHAETLFYVSVAFVDLEARSQLEALKTNLRGELNRNSSMSQYPLLIMRLRHPDGLVLTVGGGLQSHATAGEIQDELKSLASPIAATIARSDRVVSQGERAADADVERSSK